MPTPPEPTPRHPPRILSKAEAAAYCRLTEKGFDDLILSKVLPPPIDPRWGWDIVAIDHALDFLTGASRLERPKRSALAEFIAKRDERKAAKAAQAEKERKAVAAGLQKAAAIKPGSGRRGRPAK